MVPLKNKLFQFLILLVFFPFPAAGQAYVNFISTVDSSDSWTDVLSCSDFDCFTEYTRNYTLDGDTTIGGLQYTKLRAFEEYEQGMAQSQNCPVSTTYRDYYYGAIREASKQIFIKRTVSPEYLAYDFNLSVGDTVPPPDNGMGYESTRIINTIDSVMVNGAYRKRYTVASGTEIIEGIGASSGLFNTVTDFFNCFAMMHCYKENGNPHYFTTQCNPILSLDGAEQFGSEKELIKIVDNLGREINDTPNTLMIYIFSDGSAKKVYRVE